MQPRFGVLRDYEGADVTEALTERLVMALGRLVVAIEHSNAEDIDPSMASNLIEDVSFVLDELSTPDKTYLAALFQEIAKRESHPENREGLLLLPEALRLSIPSG